MLHRRDGDDRSGGRRLSRGDMLLSLALPAAVILFGVALSIGVTGGFDAFAGLCTGGVGR